MTKRTQLHAFPGHWLRQLELLPSQLTVQVAGYSVTVPMCREDLTRVYLPALNLLLEQLADRRRIVAGLAGIPGGGKSTFVAVLGLLADTLLGIGKMVAVGMDGWHWPNVVLDARTTTDEAGNTIPLRQRKGGPESFDTQAIATAIRDLLAADRAVSLPVYDRRLHDPVADGIVIGPGTSIVLFEGNFLLEPSPPWDAVSSQLDPKFFLESDSTAARRRVIERHIRGGATPDQAARKFETNDRLNTAVVLASVQCASYILRLGENAHLQQQG